MTDEKKTSIDPMEAVLERRREMLKRALAIQPPGGLEQKYARRGDYGDRKRYGRW